ncbi:hypothetical protein Nepgr_025410 [Nepenthes gracilis]|uniref:Putative rRNA methyltransferase n=1 Tax=Nepenthes gracilis TaxID=150966 RepID=A0AAD3T7Q4_NEPGR|nr:hypothetical protein Nepgr_025410 [Nepenthes gracilis]
MGKVKGKHRLDKFYHLAKEQGFRSRAAFKLIQLDSKFSFLHTAHSVLDLCAAPGGWMQVAVQRIPVGSLVIGVDLFAIRPIRGAISIEEDITTPKCRATIKKLLAQNGYMTFDVILHDGSPNVGGAWAQEATSQNALVIDSVKLATEFLSPKGTFVTKVFRSQDYNAVLYCLRQLFEKVEVTKPVASRSTSAEIYVVGLKYKAPAKIDPRLLDVKHLFQGAIEPPKVVDVLRGTKQKRHRDGYEEGATLLRKVCSAADFVWSDTPLEVLGTVTSISFEDTASLPIKNHALTTEEVNALCDDLRVLGKQDFKHLLKWRMNIRKALPPTKEATSSTVDVDKEDKDGEEEEQDDDEKILNEMVELTHAVEHKKKREKKLLAKRRAKDNARKALGMQIDALQDGYIDHELFSLASIKAKKDLEAVDSTEDVDEGVALGVSSEEDTTEANGNDLSSDLDSDEERQRYDDRLEELLDEAYEQYVSRKEGSTKQRKRARQASKEGEFLEGGDEEDNMAHPDDDSDKEEGDRETNPLVVPIDVRVHTLEDVTEKWFSQDIFAEAVDQGDLEKDEFDDVMQVDDQEHKASLPKNAKNPRCRLEDLDESDDETNIAVAQEQPEMVKENPRRHSNDSNAPNTKALKADNDFEIVPAPVTDSSDDSSSDNESDEEDIDKKAEILAYAKKMLRKKQREQMIDDGYNKYMFDDEGLPKWFIDEEKRHRQPIKPVTKEEIAAMKAQFKEINARPVKKVAEAKARKKRDALRKLEKIRKKANTISDQTDIPDRSKRRLIEQLYKKAAPRKPKKEYVVAKKGVQVRLGKGKVLVDPRMKKDARQHGMTKQGKKKGKNVKGNNKGGKGRSAKAASGARNRKGNKGSGRK